MASFQDLAKEREEKQKKFSKSSFKTKTPVSQTRAIGGASPVSVDALNRLNTLEENIEDLGLGEGVDTRLETIEDGLGSVNQNISALDTGVFQANSNATNALNAVTALNTQLNNKADIDHTHPETYLTEAQVRSLILSLMGDAEPPTTDIPFIAAGQYGDNFSYTKTWSDGFNDTEATTLFNRWQPDLMTEGLHKVGNFGRDGWRHSAYYGNPQETAFIRNDSLHMRAWVEDKPNPFRKAYTYRGRTMNPQDVWINLAFLTSWTREYDNNLDRHVTSPNAPNRTWGPGTVFEVKLSLEEMRTQCCRISFYLLPAYENDSAAYTPDGTRGIENDFPEIDFLDGYENYAQMKVISERAAGNTPLGSINLNDIIVDLDLQEGEHTFTLLWAKDRFVWYCNGIEVKRDTDPRRIPQTAHYVVISREANSGIREQRTDGVLDNGFNAYSDGTPEMPVDVGIWGRPVYEEIDKLNNDTARIISFDTWSFVDDSVAGVGIGDDTTGPTPIMLSGNPPTNWATVTSFTFQWDKNGAAASEWFIEVGSTRGGNELGSRYSIDPTREYTLELGTEYSGPVNARLWFRADQNSVWNWRDYGFSSGLQPYKTGTDGKVSVTVPASYGYVPTPPTVGGLGYVGPGDGWDGTYANGLDYTGGVVPADYEEGFTPNIVGVVGSNPPNYETFGYTIDYSVPADPGLTYTQYPNDTGELFWPAPPEFTGPIDKYELVINNIIVYRGQANSFFLEGYPVGDTLNASIRIVRDDGGYSVVRTLEFAVYTI